MGGRKGKQRTRRVEAFKRLMITKLMGSFIVVSDVYSQAPVVLRRFILASVLNGEGGGEEK